MLTYDDAVTESGRRIEFIDHIRGVTTRYYHDGQSIVAEYTYSQGSESLGLMGRPMGRSTSTTSRLSRAMTACDMSPAGIASILIHELAQHYCPITLGREDCANSAQDACEGAIMEGAF